MSDLVITTARGVTTLLLNRPAKRNAVTFDMWLSITEACHRLAADPAVRLLVVRGAGEHFCSGADIAGLGDVPAADYQAANQAADHALATFPKPTIAFVTGSCVGGGTELAIACDLRIADTSARFAITPARLGIVYPAPALERAMRLIGPSATRYLLYTAESIDTDRALRIGLVNEVHPPVAALQRLEDLADLMAHQRSLMTQMATKEMTNAIIDHGSVDPAITEHWNQIVRSSPDPTEGITAFLERRPPQFTWEA